MNSKFVIAGGVECRLSIYPISEFRDRSTFSKLTAFPHHSLVNFSQQTDILLFQHESKLSLWKLGTSSKMNQEDCFNGQVLNIKDDSTLLIDLMLKSSSLITSALSPDAQYIAAADSKSVRIFKLNYDGQVQATKLKSILPKGVTANRFVFTNDSSRLIVAGNDHLVYVINLTNETIDHIFNEHTVTDPGKTLSK